MIQFEFGPPSVSSGTHFKELFDALRDQYAIYRILPGALVPLREYEYGHEVFLPTNYLAVVNELVAAKPELW